MNLLLIVLRWKSALGLLRWGESPLDVEVMKIWQTLKRYTRWMLYRTGRAFRAFWLIINILACLVFLLSCLAPYINPGVAGVLALFGLGLPLAFSVLGILMLTGVFINKKIALLPLFFLLIGSYNIHNFIPIFPQPHIPSSCYKNITVMSWNVMNFGLLNNEHTSTATKEAVLAQIRAENPDILVLQEFYSGTDSLYNSRNELRQMYIYHYFEAPVRNQDGQKKWGQAIFSKYPIVNKHRINFPNAETNKAIVADIIVQGQMVRVFNLHLQSVHFQDSDYAAIDELRDGSVSNFPLSNFYEKLQGAFQKRGLQADKIAKNIKNSYMPVIVAGDFNDTPNSYTYRTISEGLQDAFWQTGKGLGKTYNGPIPGLRIDHMLLDPRLKVQHFEIMEKDITDHFPIISTIGIPMEE